MVGRFLDPATGRIFRASIRTLQEDVARELYRDAWTLWRRDRPVGAWDSGAAGEGWERLASGTGRLYEHGAGGPQALEGMIYPESPFRLRTRADALPPEPLDLRSAPARSHLYLVIGERLFAVDAIKAEGAEDVLTNVYLREIFDAPLPQEGGAP